MLVQRRAEERDVAHRVMKREIDTLHKGWILTVLLLPESMDCANRLNHIIGWG